MMTEPSQQPMEEAQYQPPPDLDAFEPESDRVREREIPREVEARQSRSGVLGFGEGAALYFAVAILLAIVMIAIILKLVAG
ncbi:MAG: hypothetical protein IT337_04695 [Thermomicrobiales bacterium]|nr:hypothetical protein [Thermomicrobiales bacterium]